MLIRYGYDFTLLCPQPTPLISLVAARPEHDPDREGAETHRTWPAVQTQAHLDAHGNRARRFVAPAGEFRMQGGGLMRSDGRPDPVDQGAEEMPVESLPPEVLRYLKGSRYCETDLLLGFAWQQFGGLTPGWDRVQAIIDWCHGHIRFDYQAARSTRTAFQSWQEGTGVCRDFAHLAIAICRCLNIPARYVNGHLGDIGIDINHDPMDYAAWIEVYLGGAWHTFDPRNNARRIGRIVVAYGRDAADVPMIESYGPHQLIRFSVIAEEVRQDISGAA